MKLKICVAALSLLAGAAVAQDVELTEAELEAAQDEYRQWATKFEESLDRQTGEVVIAGGAVHLTVPDDYYFLDQQDAKAVLTDAWGNPESEETLGMIFPAGMSPLDQTAWGVEITYEKDGYVSDKDASSIDYDDLLADMQSMTRDSNVWRKENGYGEIELLGWAEPPSYNAATNKMYWAKSLHFEGSEGDTLNYNIRALGRRGVLNANFIAAAEQIDQVKTAAPDVIQMIEFSPGERYADYKPGDRKAAYGLAGLVAGGAIAKKTGLLAVGLIALKKFGVFILAGFAALGGVIRRAFGGGPKA